MISSVALFPVASSALLYPSGKPIGQNVHGNCYTDTARFAAHDPTLALQAQPTPWVDVLQCCQR
jgi:hypothetical protein